MRNGFVLLKDLKDDSYYSGGFYSRDLCHLQMENVIM